MVNDVVSPIVPTVTVKQSLVSSLVFDAGAAKTLLATHARISQDATA